MSDTLAAVLGAPIDVAALPADVPAALRKLVARCLKRNLKARLRDIADARLYLDEESPADGSGIGTRIATGRAGSCDVQCSGESAWPAGCWWRQPSWLRRQQPAATPSYRAAHVPARPDSHRRFGPDFQTVLYGASVGRRRVPRLRRAAGEPGVRSFVAAAGSSARRSTSGELALALGTHFRGVMTYGTLARVPLAGGRPELQEQVKYADWSPDDATAIVRRAGSRSLDPAGTIASRTRRRSRDRRGDCRRRSSSSPTSLVDASSSSTAPGRRLASPGRSSTVAWRRRLWFAAAPTAAVPRRSCHGRRPAPCAWSRESGTPACRHRRRRALHRSTDDAHGIAFAAGRRHRADLIAQRASSSTFHGMARVLFTKTASMTALGGDDIRGTSEPDRPPR